jgi:hypothetical protein
MQLCTHIIIGDWEAFIARQRALEKQLKDLHDLTPKLVPPPLPADVHYIRPFLSSTFKDFNDERNLCFRSSFPRVEKMCE